jgi:hypothetical protein
MKVISVNIILCDLLENNQGKIIVKSFQNRLTNKRRTLGCRCG